MKIKITELIGLPIIASLLNVVPVHAAVDCNKLPHWSNTNPPISQTHVFCGEWSHNQPKGFHSRPGGQEPTTVAHSNVTQSPNKQGIYGIKWSYAGHAAVEKFSTMFPDNCTQEQILNSILYAEKNQTSCPTGAPKWASCGPNGPTKEGNYCQALDKTTFAIAFAKLTDGKINTAFPLRQ